MAPNLIREEDKKRMDQINGIGSLVHPGEKGQQLFPVKSGSGELFRRQQREQNGEKAVQNVEVVQPLGIVFPGAVPVKKQAIDKSRDNPSDGYGFLPFTEGFPEAFVGKAAENA